MLNIQQYACAICGKTYGSIEERNRCETECLAKKRKELEEAALRAKKLAKLRQEKHIQETFDELSYSLSEYLKQYGAYPPLVNEDEKKLGIDLCLRFL